MKSARFSVSLDAGVVGEQTTIDDLLNYPQPRRQQRMRLFIGAGRKIILAGSQPYNCLDFSGLPSAKQRFDLYLNPGAPDDEPILMAIKDIPEHFQTVWLRVALVMGCLASLEEIT